jgi:hypothetical protein
MDIKAWKEQCDAVSRRIAGEKVNLVELIKTRADSILKEKGVDKFIQLNGSEFTLGLDSQGESIVAWGDGWFSDLSDLGVDELLEMADCLYSNSFEILLPSPINYYQTI